MILITFALLELLKRPIFWVLYPFAWYFRPYSGLLWCALDDTIVLDNIRRGYGPLEYCGYGKRSALVEKLPAGKFREFCRAFYWGAWRNNSINLMTLQEAAWGNKEYSLFCVRRGRSFYEVRKFPLGYFPYLELWAGAWRFQAGFISCGRWQIQARKLTP